MGLTILDVAGLRKINRAANRPRHAWWELRCGEERFCEVGLMSTGESFHHTIWLQTSRDRETIQLPDVASMESEWSIPMNKLKLSCLKQRFRTKQHRHPKL
jgi:hypothetical protein